MYIAHVSLWDLEVTSDKNALKSFGSVDPKSTTFVFLHRSYLKTMLLSFISIYKITFIFIKVHFSVNKIKVKNTQKSMYYSNF